MLIWGCLTPASIVVGHKSALAFGLMGEDVGVPVVAMLGRVSHTLMMMMTMMIDIVELTKIQVPFLRRT